MKAKWIEVDAGPMVGPEEDYKCSNCGMEPNWTLTPKEILPPFCPWCGSEMEMPDEQEDI